MSPDDAARDRVVAAPDAVAAGDASAGPARRTAAPALMAAQWESRRVQDPWVPDELRDVLPWTGSFEYRDVETLSGDAAHAWRVLGISQRGRIHAHDGAHREDAMSAACGAHGFALSVADGAGSSRYSRIASALVCRFVATEAAPLVHDGIPAGRDRTAVLRDALSRAIAGACTALRHTALATNLALRDFRTTALAVLEVDGACAAVQVGDGAIIAIARDGRVTRIGGGDSGDYSGEVTAFEPELDEVALAHRVRSASLDGAEALLVMTDGIDDPFYPIERRGTEIARQLYHGVRDVAEGFRAQAQHGPVVGAPEALARLASWIGFERRGENDDRTLIGAFRLPPAFHG